MNGVDICGEDNKKRTACRSVDWPSSEGVSSRNGSGARYDDGYSFSTL